MEKIKQNLEKIIIFFILLQPIIDVLTSICINYFNINLTLGIITRMIFLLLIVFSAVCVYRKKMPLIYYCIIFIYILFFIFGVYYYKNSFMLVNELQGLMRAFYFPIMLTAIYSIRNEIKIETKWLIYTLIIYIMMVFIPNIFNIGFESYEIAKEGNIGFFNSANEISAILSILTPLLFLWIKEKGNIYAKILIIFSYIYVIFSIGTKTPLLSLIISIIFYFFIKILTLQKNNFRNLWKKILPLFLILIASFIIILPKTAFYKNIKIHLEFLNEDSVIDIVKDPMLIDHFIFSQRLTFLDNKNNLYINASLYEQLFGIGYFKDGNLTKMVEIDYCDIFFSHGLLGYIIYFAPCTCILIDIYKEKTKEKRLAYISCISIALILLLSLFTGHIITAPSVSTVAVFIMLLKYNRCNKFSKNNKEDNEKKCSKENFMITNKVKNNTDIKISIIVPIYNASKYLEKCINSLINQTMKEIEIILINDGSTDNSEQIINSFGDKRIRYFKHKNQGIGKTRNFGIRKSKGEYLIFVDSDDYIQYDMCEKMYEKAKNDNLDMVVCDFYRDKNGVLSKETVEYFDDSSIEINPELITKINLGPCNKLYDRKIIIENKIYFEEKLKYEDVPFVIDYILNSKKIGKINECLTFYCIHSNSETTIRDTRIFDILKITDIVRKKIITSKVKIPKKHLNHLIVKILTNYTVQQRYQKNRKLRNKFINECFEYMKKYVGDYKNSNYYKDRGILKSIIEKNKLLTIIYCDIYNVKK